MYRNKECGVEIVPIILCMYVHCTCKERGNIRTCWRQPIIVMVLNHTHGLVGVDKYEDDEQGE
jgi:hypothetical protein